MTPEQVAEVVQVHPRTVMRAIVAGELEASQLARRGCWRVTEDAVHEWVRRRSNRHLAPVQQEARPVDMAVADKETVRRRRVRRGPQTGRLEVPPPADRRIA